MSKKDQTKKQTDTGKQANFALEKKNYILIAIGFGLMVIGFLFMLGGGASSPDEFDAGKLFSFRRITLSTLFIVAGMVFEVFAIMRKPKAKS